MIRTKDWKYYDVTAFYRLSVQSAFTFLVQVRPSCKGLTRVACVTYTVGERYLLCIETEEERKRY